MRNLRQLLDRIFVFAYNVNCRQFTGDSLIDTGEDLSIIGFSLSFYLFIMPGNCIGRSIFGNRLRKWLGNKNE
jgi:hypothetical protein